MPNPFFTGLSGLRAHSRAVEVVANNLANLNSVAFKSSRANFSDLFYQEVGQSRSGVASQIGIGTGPISVTRRFDQGTIQSTGGLLDAAIQGEGFFITSDGGATQYSRAGNFQLNSDMEIVTLGGANVQGWMRDPVTREVNTLLPLQSITLQGNDRIAPVATQNLAVNANLQSGATQPFVRPVQVFDSLGASHILTLTFTPVAPPTAGSSSTYDVTATLPGADLAGGADANIVDVGGSTGAFRLEFDADGNLILPAGAPPYGIDLNMTTAGETFANGAGDLVVRWDLLNSLEQPRLTSVAAASAVTELQQDGSAPAELTSISIGDSGRINGLYSDGRNLTLAQIGLASFTNPQALKATGNNSYVATTPAGEPITGESGAGGLGEIVGLSLETSNVDIAGEFTDLLTYQRGYQANSRVITTADELNQEALNLKR